jgi:hypothetical protein
MAITKKILQSAVGFDLTTGKYLITATIGGVDQYWTGLAWTTTFASGQQSIFGSGTLDGQAAWTWIVPTAVDPTLADDQQIRMIGWESGVSPSAGTQAVTDSGVTSVTIYNTSAAAVSVAGETTEQDLLCSKGAAHAFSITFTDATGSPISYSGHTIKMDVADLLGNWMFQQTGTVSGISGNVVTVTVTAANTTTALATAVDATSLLHYWWDTTTGDTILTGAFIVAQAVAVH